MWPWEHAIVGYLAYSLCCHAVFRESPRGLEALIVVFASVLPDLIDKPFAWEYGVFDSGYALGHSIFVAVPLSIVVGELARRLDRPETGIAFGIGYILHLPSDLLDSAVRNGSAHLSLMLWPIESGHGQGRSGEFLPTFLRLFDGYRTELLSGDLSTYLLVQFGLCLLAFTVWLFDGAPVLRECLIGGKRLIVDLLGRATDAAETLTDRR